MNKSKTNKAWRWKVATFLPLLALLLMAFGKRGEIVPEKINLPEKVIAPSGIVQQQNEQFKQIIEIKKDGNYIDNKLCSLEEIVKKGREWYNASNDWILLLIDEPIPVRRIDEVRETLVIIMGLSKQQSILMISFILPEMYLLVQSLLRGNTMIGLEIN